MNRMSSVSVAALAPLSLALACGGAVPGTGTAENARTTGADQTFAGKNRCNPKNHDRPFVIEWDATDSSSFEAHAKNDVIFVKYEGCDLQVLDKCVNDSERGAYGSYKPVEWTSGSVEVMEIQNEGELYAKLPLGVNVLGARAHSGEKFRMEYFVAGTRNATREKIYRGDLQSRPGCQDATHYVYAYNLGAFALGASTHLSGEVGGTVWGMGAGAKRESTSKAEKAGGLLSSCRADSAKETESCKAPIRLALREIEDGTSPEGQAMNAAETPSALNLAGKLKAATHKQRQAEEHAEQARLKMGAKDGKACLAELDAHDKLDPRPMALSTNPQTNFGYVRAQCLMIAGQCDAGKQMARKSLEITMAQMGPEQIDRGVDGLVAMHCQGAKMNGRDRMSKAVMDLSQGAYLSKKEVGFCQAAIKTLNELIPQTKPKDADDATVLNAPDALRNSGPACLVKAGDCDGAFALYQDAMKRPELFKFNPERMEIARKSATMPPNMVRASFDSSYPKCKK